jgi:hypothetical protein
MSEPKEAQLKRGDVVSVRRRPGSVVLWVGRVIDYKPDDGQGEQWAWLFIAGQPRVLRAPVGMPVGLARAWEFVSARGRFVGAFTITDPSRAPVCPSCGGDGTDDGGSVCRECGGGVAGEIA